MLHSPHLFPHILSGLALVVAAQPAAAQGAPADWSRILRERWCHPEQPCPPRQGLVWDSANASPKYPEVLRGVGVGGEVVLSFTVGTTGVVNPGSVMVVRTSNRAFNAAAITAVQGWTFGADGEQRIPDSVPVQLHLIFASQGVCPTDDDRQRIGWGAWNQLVVSACVRRVPRSRLPSGGT